MRRALGGVLLASLAACATGERPGRAEFVCPDGRGFLLDLRGDDARIVLDGMKFDLRREHSSGEASRYACSMLSVDLKPGGAEVDLEGVPHLRQCRRVR